jgi:hypothetical protein
MTSGYGGVKAWLKKELLTKRLRWSLKNINPY